VPGGRDPAACVAEHFGDRAHLRDAQVTVNGAKQEEEAGPRVSGLLWRIAGQQSQALAAAHQLVTRVLPRGPERLWKLEGGRDHPHGDGLAEQLGARRGLVAGVKSGGQTTNYIELR